MQNADWIVLFGGAAAILNAVTVGANHLAVCWGPVLGAKVVTYRTALCLGCVCQLVGILAFGPRSYTIYGGFLRSLRDLGDRPELTLYAIMWALITPVIWQLLAIKRQLLVPPFLGTVASTIGASLIFPGASQIQVNRPVSSPPFVSGLGPVFLTWACTPMLSAVLVTASILLARNWYLRGEDAFHKCLWILPGTGCHAAVVMTAFAIFSIGPPMGYLSSNSYQLSAQAVLVVLTTAGIVACLLMNLAVPCMTRQMSSRGRTVKTLQRMNLLGLDDATVLSLSVQDRGDNVQGLLRRICARLVNVDIFSGVGTDDTLMRIHATAEEFDPAAEQCFVPFQAILCMCLSIAHGANNASTSVGVFHMMKALHATGVVSNTVDLGFSWRLKAGAAMTMGSIMLGSRMAPVTGVMLSKMTPARSFLVMLNSALAVAVLGALELRGANLTYAMIAAVTTIGLVEGSSHVNWRKLMTHVTWWFFGFFCVLLATAALAAQGMYAPSIDSLRTQDLL